MKLFLSWSGGKDCMLALYRILQNKRHKPLYLVNMCDAQGEQSRSHGLKKQVIEKQAHALGITIIQKETSFSDYEKNFKMVISDLKKQGVGGGVFGDIYLKEHRIWIERVCKEMGIDAIFPLWGENTMDLLNEFINLGFKAQTVSVHQKKLTKDWLGKELNKAFAKEISSLKDIDPCAENGEYHTFVCDGPIFKYPLIVTQGIIYENEKHWFQEINL